MVKIQNEITENMNRGFALYGTAFSYVVVADRRGIKAVNKMQTMTGFSAELNGIKMATKIAKER